MIHYFLKQTVPAVSMLGLMAALGLTCLFTAKFADRLPRMQEGSLPMTGSCPQGSQGEPG